MAADPDPNPLTLSGNPIIEEARKRANRVSEWEANARTRFVNDIKFRNGDADNGYQWPNMIKRSRDVDSKPCLTVNIIRQHNLMIVNQAKQNKSAVKIKAVGGGASVEGARAFEGLVRNTQYISEAQAAYSTALEFAVDGGKGWWRLVTDYVDNESDDQEVYIRRVQDPLQVFADPDCLEKDKSDMRFLLFFDLMPRDTFEELYPEHKAVMTLAPLGMSTLETDWVQDGLVRVCEYFRKVEKEDVLVRFIEPQTGERKSLLKSRMSKEMKQDILKDPLTTTRKVKETTVEWYLIAGETIIEETTWPGKYIPWVPVIGEETTIDGQYDCKGHTRNMMDAQRMYNYNASAQIEFVALQGKTPWIAPAKAIEEFESYWNTANVMNYSVLPYNDRDDENPEREVKPPFRQDPPNASPAYQTGMETAFNQMMMASGQWQNQMGMLGNERTGEAIKQRQEQADTSVYHFQDNYESALRLTGKMLIDLYPKVYDTKRVLQIIGEDGSQEQLEINPRAQQGMAEFRNVQGEVIRRVLNPQIGKYDVMSQVGPAYGTKREETVKSFELILTQNPALTGIIGDLLLQSMDFDKAQEAAQRLRRMVPPQALADGPTPTEQKLGQQITNLQAALAESLQQQGKEKLRLTGKAEARDIDAYEAQTNRMKVLLDQMNAKNEQKAKSTEAEQKNKLGEQKNQLAGQKIGLEGTDLQALVQQLVQDALKNELSGLVQANRDDVGLETGTPVQNQGNGQNTAPEGRTGPLGMGPGPEQIAENPPLPGAQKAPDGEWYILDPTRKSKFLRIAPLAQKRSIANEANMKIV